MKNLNLEQMEVIEAGVRNGWCLTSGTLTGLAASMVIGGIATGGVSLLVAGGFSAYFGGITGFVCAVS